MYKVIIRTLYHFDKNGIFKQMFTSDLNINIYKYIILNVSKIVI